MRAARLLRLLSSIVIVFVLSIVDAFTNAPVSQRRSPPPRCPSKRRRPATHSQHATATTLAVTIDRVSTPPPAKRSSSARRRHGDAGVKNKRTSGVHRYDDDGDTSETNRLKSQIHQLRGRIIEANLRATAAERRVALLKSEQEATSGGGMSEKQLDQLLDKRLKKERKSHQAELTKLQSAFDAKRAELEAAVSSLEASLDDANQSIDSLTSERNELEHDLKNLQNEHAAQSSELEQSMSADVSKWEAVAQEASSALEAARVDAEKDIAEARNQLAHVEATLTKQLREAKAEAAQTKERLEAAQYEMKTRKDSVIEQYERERMSLRKLMRLSWKVVRGRIAGLFRRRRR